MIKLYFKVALKNIWKDGSALAINLFGLSVGMSASICILLWVNNEISYDDFHPNASRIYRLTADMSNGQWTTEDTPFPLAYDVKKEIPEIEKSARLVVSDAIAIMKDGTPEKEKRCAYVDPDWFSMFSFYPIKGNTFSLFDSPNGIVLTEDKAKQYLGEHADVGSLIKLNDRYFSVVAIVKNPPANTIFQFDIYLPLEALNNSLNPNAWYSFNTISFVQIASNSGIKLLQKKISSILARNHIENSEIKLVSLRDVHFEEEIPVSEFKHQKREIVAALFVLAALILITACINYLNINMLSITLRSKEVGVRKLIGARRLDLMAQYLFESGIFIVLTFVLTIGISLSFSGVLERIVNARCFFSLSSPMALKVSMIVLAATFLLNSIYPASYFSSFNPIKALDNTSPFRISGSWFRKILTVVQFSISLVLLLSSLIIYKQMRYVDEKYPGYDRLQVLSLKMPDNISRDQVRTWTSTFKQEILRNSSIESVSATDQSPVNLENSSSGLLNWQGKAADYNPLITELSADESFLSVMHLKMKSGRWFDSGSRTYDQHSFIVNQTAVRLMDLIKDPVDQEIIFHNDTGRIVGIVQDFIYQSMHDKIGPVVIYNDPSRQSVFLVRIHPGTAKQAIGWIKETWDRFFMGSPFEYSTLEDSYKDLYKDERQIFNLLVIFSTLAVGIATIGLFGTSALTAAKKRKDIAIRRVLGITLINAILLQLKDFLGLFLTSIVIASLIGGWIMSKWLDNFAYRIHLDVCTFVVAYLFGLIIVILTVGYNATKTALSNPARTLRRV